jgi:ADP-dependent NAD(P)H-hydrate dehydratase / NAD(P)H-hydrate epimerase
VSDPNASAEGKAMHELLTAEEMGRADRLTIEGGVAGAVLMENAGRGVADEISARFPDASTVAVLCGPGNNGGDGFVAARHLMERGYRVRLGFDGDPAKLPADAAHMAARFEGAVGSLGHDLLADAEVIVDGLFGAGLARPVEGKLAALIDQANECGAPIMAIDVPSGIDGTTGAVRGTAIRATATVTFFRRKPGHLLLPGRLYCGAVRVVDIGIPASVLETVRPNTFANEPGLWLPVFPWPTEEGHKYLRGHALVASGPMDSTGAARLAARGALRAGAGLVTVASPRNALAVNAAQLAAIMVREADGAQGISALLADPRKNAFLIGPGHGVGEETRAMVLAALKAGPAVVLDADALTSFADDKEALFEAIRAREAPVVMTPHEGEFARLFGDVAGDSKVEKARAAASRAGATVVLKGADTVIAAPDGQAAIDANGTPWLATAGSGDVLGGMILGLLAQGMPGFLGACAAVWMHGQAAKIFGPGLIAEDLPEMLPQVLRGLERDRAQG